MKFGGHRNSLGKAHSGKNRRGQSRDDMARNRELLEAVNTAEPRLTAKLVQRLHRRRSDERTVHLSLLRGCNRG